MYEQKKFFATVYNTELRTSNFKDGQCIRVFKVMEITAKVTF